MTSYAELLSIVQSLWNDTGLRQLMRPDQVRRIEAVFSGQSTTPSEDGREVPKLVLYSPYVASDRAGNTWGEMSDEPDGEWLHVDRYREHMAAKDAAHKVTLDELHAQCERIVDGLKAELATERQHTQDQHAAWVVCDAERQQLRADLATEVCKNSTQVTKENDELHAEIARLKELAHETGATVSRLLKANNEKRDELIELRTQPARQMGGDERVLRQLLGSVLCYVERDIERMRGDREKADDKVIYDRSIAQAEERLKAAMHAVFTTEPGCATGAALAPTTELYTHGHPLHAAVFMALSSYQGNDTFEDGVRRLIEELQELRNAPAAVVEVDIVETLIEAIDKEQERLSNEDNYLMDSDDCIKVIRETVASLNRRAMPEGLLQRIETLLDLRAEFDPTYPPETHPVNDDAELLIELRALLGKHDSNQG